MTVDDMGQVTPVVSGFHYASPVLILAYFISSSIVSACYLQSTALKARHQNVRRDILLWLMFFLVICYLLQALNILVYTLVQGEAGTSTSEHENVYILSSIIVWGVQTLAVVETDFPVWYPYYVSWIIGMATQLVVTVATNVSVSLRSPFNIGGIITGSLQLCVYTALLGVFFGLRNSANEYKNIDAEQQSLLKVSSTTCATYGTSSKTKKKGVQAEVIDDGNESDTNADQMKIIREDEERMLRRLRQDGSFWAYLRGFRIFLPHMLPFQNKLLMFRGVMVLFCLLATNVVNILLPRQFGVIVDLLGTHDQHSVWLAAAGYAGLVFFGQGLISWLRYWLWLPIEQFGQQSLLVAAHSHVMNLSCDFHDSKESFQIHQAVAQGAHVTSIVETVCFEIFPMLVDLCLATAYLYWLFGPYLSLTVACTALAYIYTTSKLVSMSNDKRRMSNALLLRQWRSGFESIDGWVTASLFNNLKYEQDKYSRSVDQRLEALWSYGLASRLIGVAQVFVMTTGLLAAMNLAIYQCVYGSKTVGDFTTLFMYWAQLRAPLTYFSRVYKELSNNMMDAERLLDLFQTKPTIVDLPNAKALVLTTGEIRFQHVSHTYDGRSQGLSDINFVIAGGQTVAVVGETGSGKSTIMKLLNRFYDVSSGDIFIDGQNVREVTLKSLRTTVGVVPQEPAIFDSTILANVAYGRLGSTTAEVHEACKAASIHDKIMSFPDGYLSKVGRRGVKLSGGERQRLAIARTILKNPSIIILDEATSALDTNTEQNIQDSLRALSHGRTTLIVAHRLSTIINADKILVCKDGKIIESGSHNELIKNPKGKYYELWKKQVTVKRDRSRSKDPGDPSDAIIVKDLRVPSFATVSSPPRGCSKAVASPLKPDAPEFFPRSLFRHSSGRTSTDRHSSGAESKMQKKQAKRDASQERKEGKKMAKEAKAAQKALKKSGAGSQYDGLKESSSSSTENLPSSAVSYGPEESGEIDTLTTDLRPDIDVNKVHYRKPHHTNRRYLSKSEPVYRDDESEHSAKSGASLSIESPIARLGILTHQSRCVTAPSTVGTSREDDHQ